MIHISANLSKLILFSQLINSKNLSFFLFIDKFNNLKYLTVFYDVFLLFLEDFYYKINK